MTPKIQIRSTLLKILPARKTSEPIIIFSNRDLHKNRGYKNRGVSCMQASIPRRMGTEDAGPSHEPVSGKTDSMMAYHHDRGHDKMNQK